MADNQKTVIQIMIVFIIAIIGFTLISILFGGGMMGGGMMGGMGFGSIFMLLPILFIIFLIYALTERDRPTYDQPPYPPQYQSPYQDSGNPLLILEQRYANGKISREDYLRMREDLKGR